MKNYYSLLDLSNQIDHLRKQMIEIGTKKGLKSPETLFQSQELDKLIYAYQSLTKGFREPSKTKGGN
ncbi:aspartyl-phosphate phosphatase Spo0E family protein [Bacillus sp. FJAT-49736]|uniref:aspartyl-phosphate phosphatase Spo0E family protein n=1 Tax=Bacillus sp. FJAT-49736 TaxID=2833582 RepID=UPI001BCA3D56|nr:aspartyl-phosphate phosphatase Spo0E family protein [Bacillus sp. FJAT-49736]MBS4174953.1 aspartyl-phosphate phosphatase Spo0E family protein [Bacillus sp. FJAT-49736]